MPDIYTLHVKLSKVDRKSQLLVYSLILAYYRKMQKTGKISFFFRQDLWDEYRKVLREVGLTEKDIKFDPVEVCDTLNSLIGWNLESKYSLAEKLDMHIIRAFDFSGHYWLDGRTECLVRLRGCGTAKEVIEALKPWVYEIVFRVKLLKEGIM